MVYNIKEGNKRALNKSKKSEADIIQGYNGYGKLYPSTEASFHGGKSKAFYGVPIPKKGLDMNTNPLYGKEVMDIRDNVLAKNKSFTNLVNQFQGPTAPISHPKNSFANSISEAIRKKITSGRSYKDINNTISGEGNESIVIDGFAKGGTVKENKYSKNKPTYKPKFPGKLETNQVDDTYVAPAVSDMRNAEQKKLDYKNYKDNQKLGKSIQNIAVQTALDQVNIPYTEGMKNTRRNFPIGTMINSANDVNDLPSFSNPYLGVINTSLNRIKPSVPVMGDLAVNALQEGLQRGDEEYATNDFKAKKYLKEKGIDPKNIGYIKPFAKGGRVLPKFAEAGTVDTGAGITDYAGYAQMAMPIAHMLMPDQQVKDTRGNVVGNKMDTGYAMGSKALDWGTKGLTLSGGNPFIGAAAGVAGAIVGGFENESNNKKIDKQKLLDNDNIYNEDTSKAFNTNTGNFTQRRSTNTNMSFAAGGQVVDEDMGNPNAELELNETFRDPMTGETGMVDGPSHDNGGIEMSLAEGTQIWSDRLKHNGRTFASLTKPIINKIANIEKGLDTNPNSRFKQNSIKLLNAQLDFFFDIQESDKQQDEMKRTLKKQEGGVVDDMGNYHYANGGIYIKPENRGKFTAYKERTGKTTEEALHSPDPHVRQMANFAKNAAGWKHAEGGYVLPKYYLGGEDEDNGPNTADIYKRPTSNVNGIEISNNPYDKRQFMLDQINTNRTFYNGDSAKTSNSFGATSPETIQGRQLPAFADAFASRPTVNNAPVYSGSNDPFRKMSNQYDPNIVNASKVNTTPAYQPYNSGATKPGGMINFNRELPKPVLPQVYNSTPYIKARGNQNPYKGTDIAGTKTVDNNGNITDSNLTNNTPISKMDEFRNRIDSFRKRGKIGQGVTAAVSNLTQADRLKGLARPDKISNVNYLSSLTGPDLVNFGNQRNAIEQGANAVTDKAARYLGNSGSIMATVNAANLAKQQQLAESYQGQENTNAGIMNQSLAQKNQASMAQAERNSAIDQENKANKYGYNAMLASGLNANDAITASQMGQMYGNDVTFGNDLEKSRVLSNMYNKKVWDSTNDNTIAANNSQLRESKFGGVIGKLNKPIIKKNLPGKRTLKSK
jgi:hypothetical protein